jgi:hypothetical protein
MLSVLVALFSVCRLLFSPCCVAPAWQALSCLEPDPTVPLVVSSCCVSPILVLFMFAGAPPWLKGAALCWCGVCLLVPGFLVSFDPFSFSGHFSMAGLDGLLGKVECLG